MKRIISIFLTLVMLFASSTVTLAKSSYDIDSVLKSTASYIYKTVQNPTVGSVGGEWAIIGLARSGEDIPSEYYLGYYKNTEEYIKSHKGNLHDKKYTEYSRVVLALTAIGKNPHDVSDYNLLMPLGDYEKTVWQGVNGAIWALIALDSNGYAVPKNSNAKVQATREMYIAHILKKQTSDGGWALSGDVADPDITAMALQALSNYQSRADVKAATEKALVCLSKMQNKNGGFSTYGEETSESSIQVLVALCCLGISAEDSRFVKGGNSVVDNIMSYYNGTGFKHTHSDKDTNLMATEQALYGLTALKRSIQGKSGLYSMSDALSLSDSSADYGLGGRHKDVKKMSVSSPGKTFNDIKSNKSKTAIEALASRGIINGKTESTFEPGSTMTRAEFATIIARGLGLPQKNMANFKDVTKNDWFYSYVGTAYSYGIVKGVSETQFNPNGTISREEVAVMVTRAAKLCGMNTEMASGEIRNTLCVFTDYVKASDWAQGSLAFCYREGILSDEVSKINPKQAVTRAEIAEMLYNLLMCAKLL